MGPFNVQIERLISLCLNVGKSGYYRRKGAWEKENVHCTIKKQNQNMIN